MHYYHIYNITIILLHLLLLMVSSLVDIGPICQLHKSKEVLLNIDSKHSTKTHIIIPN